MKKVFALVSAAIALSIFIYCAAKKSSKEETTSSSGSSANAPTRVAITNNNTSGTTTVTLTSPPPYSETATFSNVGFGTTSAYQSLTFSSYSGVAVACSATACAATNNNVILNRNADNTIQIKTGLEPAANADASPPTVSSTSPTDAATGSATNSNIVVTFSEPMQTTLTTNTGGTTCSGSVQLSTTAANFASCIQMTSLSFSGDYRTVTLVPAAALSASTSYKIRVTTAAQDKTGVAIAAQFTTGTGFTTGAAADVTAPSAVTLSSPSKGQTSVDLQWTETGDDASTGNASTYELRYSNASLSSANFSSASLVVSGTPGAPGAAGSRTVSGLSAGVTYYFMYKICDEVPNCAYSNNLSVTTDAATTTTTTGLW